MNTAILLSGGKGSRMGTEIPKQYLEISGRPVFSYSLEVLEQSSLIDGIQIVCEKQWQDTIRDHFRNETKLLGFSLPGQTRSLSILNALLDLKDCLKDDDVVFIHDAARPNLAPELMKRLLLGMEGYDGAMPVLPMKDTVYFSEDGQTVSSLLEREKIVAGQTPEAFLFGKYLAANEALLRSGELSTVKGSTEPAIRAGMKIALVCGDEKNEKLTTAADLERFASITGGEKSRA